MEIPGDLDELWRIWVLVSTVNALGWAVLPFSGGILDQPDWVLNGLLTIEEVSQRVRKLVNG